MDTPTSPKVKGKKIPPLAIGAAAIAAVGIVIYLRKKAASSTGTSSSEPGTEGLSNQSFIPVTGENVGGVGASGGGGSSNTNGEGALLGEVLKTNIESEKEQNKEFQEFIANSDKENRESQAKFYESVTANLGTGGGSQAAPGAPGTVTAPPESHAAAPSPPPAVPPSQPAPPAKPAPPPYKIIKDGQGCECHQYSNHTECQVKTNGKCVWP